LLEIEEKSGSLAFTVRVIPRASRGGIVGEHDGAVKVRLTSPPVDGAANAELIKLMAKSFGVARSNIDIIAGETSKTKRIRITGVTAAQLQSLIGG
jgi:uncharacterized protein